VKPNPRRPETHHAPKRDEDGEKVGHQEHGFGPDLEIFLDIPEPERRCD
jgi:hypothetical protein